MPKTRTVKSFRQSSPKPENDSNTKLSRGQRKRQAKREQYLARERLVQSSLVLEKQEEQKRRIDGLDELKEALMVVSATKANKVQGKKQQRIQTNRAKKQVTAVEVTQMNLVLDHPSFKADPFSTIQEHLKNTLKGQADKLEKDARKRQEEDEDKRAAEKQDIPKRRKKSRRSIRTRR